MQNRACKRFYVIIALFFALFLRAVPLFASQTLEKPVSAVHKLNPAHNITASIGNNGEDIILNGSNYIQTANYRFQKTGHSFNSLFIELFSLFIFAEYLKNKRKTISSGYARFLRLLLFPNHVFW
ncbi:hypothetical protein MgSA37_00589 [Mucilaginibacter gotjawali]|uniref:Uncharacterized protein n=2 Tax=Mucilaginibacter gotjawali TaxID=1550579 RepID=A0A110B0J4_9SPHI|nr:hypothetical protein [Mucilaginibacter gotjawali]BAU52428.1 hypothetical protein MgSA37_00589 [Mucilaginibacter gotjawali]